MLEKKIPAYNEKDFVDDRVFLFMKDFIEESRKMTYDEFIHQSALNASWGWGLPQNHSYFFPRGDTF